MNGGETDPETKIVITPDSVLDLGDVLAVAKGRAQISLSSEVLQLVDTNFRKLADEEPSYRVYGYNTGIGDSCDEPLVDLDQSTLQRNLVLSHACGSGGWLRSEVVRAMIFCRCVTLSKGASAVRGELLRFLVDLLNRDLTPKVHAIGSIGASDLSQLAECFACIFDKGEVLLGNQSYSPFEAFSLAKIEAPDELCGREGLALINGNDCSIASLVLSLDRSSQLLSGALAVAALSLSARKSSSAALQLENNSVKPLPGQRRVIAALSALLENDNLVGQGYDQDERMLLQDPPSFRCVSQVFGQAFNAYWELYRSLLIELNGVTDNPLIFHDETLRIVSSGNFFCAELAAKLDQFAHSIAQIAIFSGARSEILVDDRYNEGLPRYLISSKRGHAGMMIPIYTAQSVLGEVQALRYPRTTLSPRVANGWENVSTNIFNSAQVLEQIIEHASRIISVELVTALQALALRIESTPAHKIGEGVQALYNVAEGSLDSCDISLPLEEDQYMQEALVAAESIFSSDEWREQIEHELGSSNLFGAQPASAMANPTTPGLPSTGDDS